MSADMYHQPCYWTQEQYINIYIYTKYNTAPFHDKNLDGKMESLMKHTGRVTLESTTVLVLHYFALEFVCNTKYQN